MASVDRLDRPSPTPNDRPHPLQNRVLPDGEIVAVPERGLLMGNRGCIHDQDRRLRTSRWRSNLWICCVLDWEGVRRDVMPPGRWTALFFLDEATALAAGHRPCAYCRYPAYVAFAEAWQQAAGLPERPRATKMNAALHAERVDRQRRHITRLIVAGDLPDGAVVRHDGGFALVQEGALRRWSWQGYGPPIEVAPTAVLPTLTPPSILATLAEGYRPILHPSAST